MAIGTKFYQKLSDIIPTDNIPGDIVLIENGVEDLLDKLFFSDSVTQKTNSGGGGYAYRGSFNPLLSCLRSFGLMEAIRDNIFYMATHTSADDTEILTGAEADAIKAFIQTIIDAVVIPANISVGFPLDVTYDIYQKLKWFEDEADKDEYVEP